MAKESKAGEGTQGAGTRGKKHRLVDSDAATTDLAPPAKMSEKDYQKQLRRLHGEIVALQEWAKASGAKVGIVFEGRDTAGKGGVIKAITERVSPGCSG